MSIKSASIRIPGASLFAMSIALVGCTGADNSDAYNAYTQELSVLSQAPVDECQGGDPQGDQFVFEITKVGPAKYHFYQRARLDRSLGSVWAKVRNFQALVAIVLPTATDFQWLHGGGPGKIPSQYSFKSDTGVMVVEEVYFRSQLTHTVKYHLLEPAIGMREYVAAIRLTPALHNDTIFEYDRYIEFEDDASLASMSVIFEQEMVDIKQYFEVGAGAQALALDQDTTPEQE